MLVQQNQESSRLGIQVGNDFEGEGKSQFQINIDFSVDQSNQQIQKLKELTNNELDTDWSVVLELQAKQGQVLQLHQGLQKLFEAIKNDDTPISSKSVIVGEKIYVSLKWSDNELLDSFNMFYDQGLSEIALTQSNTVNIKINSNQDFHQVMSNLQEKERLVSALLKQFKIEVLFNLNKQLAAKIRELALNFDPEQAQNPIMQGIQKFKNFDIDLKFLDSDRLTDNLKKKLLPLKEISNNTAAENAFQETDQDYGALDIANSIHEDVQVWFTINGFVAVQVSSKLFGLGKFFLNYGAIFD